MSGPVRLRSFVLRLLLAALLVAGCGARVCAQQLCPSPRPTLAVTSPANGATGLGGVVSVQISLSSLPAGYTWYQVHVIVYDSSFFADEVGWATITGANSAVYQWDTSLTIRRSAGHNLVAVGAVSSTAGICNDIDSGPVWVVAANPAFDRNIGSPKVSGGNPAHSACTGSSTDPRTASQSWTVPITAWDYKGATFPFALAYNSLSLVDPGSLALPLPSFDGLSERNSKWSHPYSQWIDLYSDDSGAQWAIWHRGGRYLQFRRYTNNVFTNPDSSVSMSAGGGPITTPAYNCNGQMQTQQVLYGYFKITDAGGTEYDFNYQPPAGQTHLVWELSDGVSSTCLALPQFLLTRIVDRWGRALNVTWNSVSVNGGMEPRVTAVMDAGDASIGQNPRGVTLSYSNGLLSSVQDPQGRTHTLAYSAVPDENGTNRQKLTGVTVYGPGSPSRVVYNWQFAYSLDPTTNNLAYAGTYTGDLVIQKTAPDGMVTSYQYQAVTLSGSQHQRLTPYDWDGRVTQVSWMDGSQGPPVQKVISWAQNSGTQFTLTYPGTTALPIAVQYNYSGTDLASVVDLATNRTWSYTYDSYHNLVSVRSPLETGTYPLIQYTPTLDATGHITQMQEQVLQDGGTQGDPVTTVYNGFNLPTQVTAAARSGSGRHDQATQFQYDGGTLTKGNLTAVLDGWNDNTTMPPTFHSLQETDFTYAGANGAWGLPDSVKNAVGGVSSFTYDAPTGRLLTAASPQNLVVAMTHPDRPASVATLQYNTDGLPSLVQDPLGHQESVSYNQDASATSNLRVTITHVADGSARSVVLDPDGKVLKAIDENGIVTVWTYNPQGQVVKVQRAFGTDAERDTLYHYNAQGDLDSFTPPNGTTGTVSFDYRRYQQDGTLDTTAGANGTYEGQVTKISYPVTSDYPSGTAEYFGYNNAGELAWRKKQDGTIVTILRDALHRIKEVDYPSGPGGSAFSVTAQYDEFGRTTNTADATGSTMLAYDDLNRLTSLTPPSPQQAITYSYTADTTLQRWTTTATVASVGSYVYAEDSKGRLSQVTNPFNQQFWREYDLDGKSTAYRFPSGSASPIREARTYTSRDWLASIGVYAASGTPVDTFTYGYTDTQGHADPTGQIHSETDMGNRVHVFAYNKHRELVYESHPDFGTNNGPIAYSYDRNGNRLTRSVNGVCDFYGVDANNKLQWVNHNVNAAPTSGQTNPYMLFSYDANGNTTHRERQYGGLSRSFNLLWDGDDRLRQVNEVSPNAGTPLTASYGGSGLRVSKTENWTGTAQTHNYTWGPGGVVYDSLNATTYTPGSAQRVSGTDRFSHPDWLGNTRYLSDSTGNSFPAQLRFDAFGNRSATGGTDAYDPTDFQFGASSGYQTEYASTTEPGLGLQYLLNRYYDPATGRFISQDPLGYTAGLNLYRYAGNSPTLAVDPSGLTLLPIPSGPYASAGGTVDVEQLAAGVVGAVVGGLLTLNPAGALGGFVVGVTLYGGAAYTGSALGNYAAGQGSIRDVIGGAAITLSAVVPGGGLGEITGQFAGGALEPGLLECEGGVGGSEPEGVGLPSQRWAFRAAMRRAGIGRNGTRVVKIEALNPKSRSPEGDPGVRTVWTNPNNGVEVHHDPSGNYYEPGSPQNIGPHYGVEKLPGVNSTVHFPYESEHDPSLNR